MTTEITEFTTLFITNNQGHNTSKGQGDQDADILIMFRYQLYIHL